jgi:hypothetical protein
MSTIKEIETKLPKVTRQHLKLVKRTDAHNIPGNWLKPTSYGLEDQLYVEGYLTEEEANFIHSLGYSHPVYKLLEKVAKKRKNIISAKFKTAKLESAPDISHDPLVVKEGYTEGDRTYQYCWKVGQILVYGERGRLGTATLLIESMGVRLCHFFPMETKKAIEGVLPIAVEMSKFTHYHKDMSVVTKSKMIDKLEQLVKQHNLESTFNYA